MTSTIMPKPKQSKDVFEIVFAEPEPQVRKMLMGEVPISIALKPTAENLGELMGLKKATVNQLMGFSPSRKSRTEILDLEAVDRIFTVLEIRRRVEHFLGPDTDTWLQKPNKHLEHKTPLELIETRVGTQSLMNYLNAVESGHYL